MSRKTFTLIEVIVVMAIITFLAATLVVSVKGLKEWAKIQRCKTEVAQISSAVESYHADTGVYPPDYMSSDHDEDGAGGNPGQFIKEPRGKYYFHAPRIPNPDDPPAWLVWTWDQDTGTESAAYSFSHISWGPDGLPGGGNDVLNYGHPEHVFTENAHDLIDFDTGAITNGNISSNWSASCSCGWHSLGIENLEQAHNYAESGKALYDFLCRPMKGRQDETGNDWPGIQPYYEPDASSVVPCGHDEGWGAVKAYDSNKLVDPWGRSMRYATVCREFRKWNPRNWDGHAASGEVMNIDTNTDPDIEEWKYDFSMFRNDGWNPKFNKHTFDLYSTGPDGRYYDGIKDPNCSWDADNDNIMNWIK